MKFIVLPIGCLCLATGGLVANALTIPSSTDLWDVSQSITILNGSPTYSDSTYSGFDLSNMFGGTSGSGPGAPFDTVIFADSFPSGFTHFVEWQTTAPVSVNSFRLFATGDGPSFNNQRDFDRFTLLAKSPGSTTYNVLLYSFTPTHPYSYLDPVSYLTIEANIPTYVGSDFRAEFVSRGGVNDGPRVIELDAFSSRFPASGVPDASSSLGLLAVSFGILTASRMVSRRTATCEPRR